MPVKYWSFAGLLLTYWCNSRCASCYLCCSPDRGEWMTVDEALGHWRGLMAASPHGCRVHVSGGEPFGDWESLIGLCRRAQAEGLGPLEKVETNAFWATGERIVAERLRALDAAGMGKLAISADPYHQQYVPLERCRTAARVGGAVLGPGRVQVRWRDWLAAGFDTGDLDRQERAALFGRYAARGRDRVCGRASEALVEQLSCKPGSDYADMPCGRALLRSRHVHVGPGGCVMPGTCVGIVLGRADLEGPAEIWRRLEADHDDRAIVGRLARLGPSGLLPLAEPSGFVPRRGYAGKCHLCWDIRRHLAGLGLHGQELGPSWLYGV